MSESICNYVPPKGYGDLRTVHFVYETEHHTLHQPFFRPFYCLFLVTNGTAEVMAGEVCLHVQRGSLYFFLPSTLYTVNASKDFRYMYISFTGEGVADCLAGLHLPSEPTVYSGHTELIDFWFSAIVRVKEQNANLLSESVLLYTLAALLPTDKAADEKNGATLCQMMADYVSNHFTEVELSLGKVADFLGYTEKYLSMLFKRHMHIGFRGYLSALRLEHAKALLEEGGTSVAAVAIAVGYRDALYFSRAFKAHYGISPGKCIPH